MKFHLVENFILKFHFLHVAPFLLKRESILMHVPFLFWHLLTLESVLNPISSQLKILLAGISFTPTYAKFCLDYQAYHRIIISTDEKDRNKNPLFGKLVSAFLRG